MWAYAHEAGRLAIAVTLLVAGASKLVSPGPLARSLGQTYRWSGRSGTVAARAVAVVELLAAFLLASYWAATAGLALAGLVGAGIVAFVATALRRGSTAPCGCFGEVGGRPIGARNLLAGTGLLGGAIALLVLPGGAPAAAPAELALPLTVLIALVAVMVRDRVRLLAPFLRHFRPPPAAPEPLLPEVT